jgi:ankyrin repeat protein
MDVEAVRAWLASGPALWETREALERAVEGDQKEIARMLLAYGAWPDHAGRRWGRWGGCLHAALLLERDSEMIEVLFAGGAKVSARDRDGRTPLAIAVRTGNETAAALLRRHGAGDAEVSEVDRQLGACVGGDRPVRVGALRRSDHQHICWAVRRGRIAAISALLAFGCDPDVPDDDGETALHLAVAARSPAALVAVLAGNPRVDALDYRNETALTCAQREPDGAVRAALVAPLVAAGGHEVPLPDPELFEQAVDAIVDGKLEQLRGLLDQEPRLVWARSLRPHRCTLLHYVAANGTEKQRSPANAGAIAELLLARGADPNALCMTYGGGPGQTTLGLTVTSCHPDDAGVMGDIVHALARGGAKVNGLDGDAAPLRGAYPSAWPALLAHGANVDLVSAAMLGRLDQVKRLLRPDQVDEAFLAACRARHPEVVAFLLDAGARLDARDAQGMTGLHLATWGCDLDTVRLLIARGAPLEARNDYGGTVLDFVVWVVRHQFREGRDYAALIETLVQAGADVGAVEGLPTGRDAVDAVFRRCGKLG